MGREIRRVPFDWEHPRYTSDNASRSSSIGKFIPLYDDDYESACEKWLASLDAWRNGTYPEKPDGYKYMWDWDGGPPSPDSYRERKWTPEEATHYQVYETVSEGTPVTPHFVAKEELVEYLVKHGDNWHHGQGWPRQNAERFVQSEWAMSGIYTPQTGFRTVQEEGFYPDKVKG